MPVTLDGILITSAVLTHLSKTVHFEAPYDVHLKTN